MIEFDTAIATARHNIIKLIPGASDVTLEGALVSPDKKLYEITYSYNLESPADAPASAASAISNIELIAKLVGKRREYKVFLIDSETGEFRGFTKCKEG